MKGERTKIEFKEHELRVLKQDGLLIHHLKKPETNCDNIKFVNTNDLLVVTGDYGNWIFCREFHPSADGGVSDGYWKEKLRNSSSQEPNEFDEEGTIADIKEFLREEDLREEEKEYLNGCLDNIGDGQFDYEYYAHRNNVGRFQDHESVPHRMKTKFWLEAVFDGFDEICRRMKADEVKPE